MANRFLSRGSKNTTDDDDLVMRQLSALGDTPEDEEEEAKPVVSETRAPVRQQEIEKPAPEVEKKSVLQQGMVVTGSISSATPLFVYGTVNGDISCESDITVDGCVNGNVKAVSIQVLSGHIKGDVESKSSVCIQKGATIDGNVTGDTLTCDGKLEGNTNVKGKAAIKENAVIIGDIACEKISISEGAVCKGSLQTDVAKMSSSYVDETTAKAKEVTENRGVVTDLKKYI